MNKHIKLYEDFVNEANEAFRVEFTGNQSIDRFGLAEAGVEMPNFHIDLSNLQKKRRDLLSLAYKLRKIQVERIEKQNVYAKPQPIDEAEVKKIEKGIADGVKIYNNESKKIYKNFVKVLKGVKFPASAKYKVDTKEEDRENIMDGICFDLEGKKRLNLFEATIETQYCYLAPGEKWEEGTQTYTRWSRIVLGTLRPSVNGFVEIPSVLDKAFILDRFLNCENSESYNTWIKKIDAFDAMDAEAAIAARNRAKANDPYRDWFYDNYYTKIRHD